MTPVDRRDVAEDVADLHEVVAIRMAAADQRYTRARRSLVEALFSARRPLTVPEILAVEPRLPQSSVYRNVTALMELGIARRVESSDDHGRFELEEEFTGHHHHLVCRHCGQVNDLRTSARLERAFKEAAQSAASEWSFAVSEHRVDFVGTCADCRDP